MGYVRRLAPLALGAALTACGASSPPYAAGVCWMRGEHGGFALLADNVENLETCGARLEAVYLRGGRPVLGAFGGVYVLVDRSGIDAQAPNGPRVRLLSAPARRQVDDAIRALMAKTARNGSPGSPAAS